MTSRRERVERAAAPSDVAMALAYMAIGVVVGLLLLCGPASLHTATSTGFVAELRIPAWGWGLLFLAYAGLLMHRRTRAAAFALGFPLTGVWVASYAVSIDKGGVHNIVLLGISFAVPIHQLVCARWALIARSVT